MKTTEQMIQALEVLGYTVRPPMTDKQVLDEWARMNFAPAPPADTKHKWHDAIVAWAEGKPVQYRTKSGKAVGQWYDFTSLRGTPTFGYPEYEWRVRPETMNYRVALFNAGWGRAAYATNKEEVARSWEKLDNFDRWLTPWQEVEV